MSKKITNFYQLFFSVLLIGSLYSCREKNLKIEIPKEAISDLQYILSTEKITIAKIDNNYNLVVYQTKLKTQFGKKMAASVAAIQLYNQIIQKNDNLNFETNFQVIFYNTNDKYLYKLENVNQALNAQEIIHDFIKKLMLHESNNLCKSNFQTESQENLESENLTFTGFEQMNQSICGINRNITVWQTFTENKQISFYVDNNKREVVQINELE